MIIPALLPCSTSNGHARVLGSGAGAAVAAASSGAVLAVVTQQRRRKHYLSCYSMQVGCWAGLRMRMSLSPPHQHCDLTS